MIVAEEQLNKLLLKQIQKKNGGVEELSPEIMELMVTISRTYDNYERERQLIERAMDLSSNEMAEANRQLEKQASKLQRSNQELKEFAYAVSHDLKEPLRTIASYIQLIQHKINPHLDGETKEFMTFAVSGVKRLKTMLEGMLHYAQVSETNKELSTQDLNRVMDIVLENLKENIAMNQARVTLLKPLPVIKGNPIQLVQLFQNLVANSIKFRTEQSPFIQINYTDKRTEHLISVSDNGIGVQDTNKQVFFNMFKRGHNGTHEGIGMGLSICKKIVENHGGSIWIDNDVQQGTRIDISFPKQ